MRQASRGLRTRAPARCRASVCRVAAVGRLSPARPALCAPPMRRRSSRRIHRVAAAPAEAGAPEVSASSSLDVSVEEDDGFVTVTVVVPPAKCEEAYKAVLDKIRGGASVPGFRNKDKVPADLLIKACGGIQNFHLACTEHVLHDTVEEAMSELSESVIDGSLEFVSDAQQLSAKFSRESALTYAVRAEVGNIGFSFKTPYKGLDIEVEGVLTTESEQRKVDIALTMARRERGGELSVASREARQDDTLIVDFSVRNRATGAALPGLESEKFELDTANEDGFIPGVVEHILGMRVGEQKHIEFTFPQNWEPEELAGVDATVKVKVREVLVWTLPEVDLQLCQSINKEVTSVDDFMTKMREAVQYEASIELQDRIQSAVLQKLAEISTIERIPRVSFEDFARSRYENDLQQAINSGLVSQEQIKQMTTEDVVNSFVESKREELEGEFRATMALYEIGEKEQLTVDEKLVQEEAESFVKQAKQDGRGTIEVSDVLPAVHTQHLNTAAMAFLQKNNNIKVIEPEDAATSPARVIEATATAVDA